MGARNREAKDIILMHTYDKLMDADHDYLGAVPDLGELECTLRLMSLTNLLDLTGSRRKCLRHVGASLGKMFWR